MAPTVHFPIHRQYTTARQSANNAMVSFLAGSALASHTLQLTAGSDRLLPEIFPAVPHIARFNLRPDAAAEVLGAAGPHLATVTIPYALAIHENFVTQCIRWIKDAFNFPAPGTVPSIKSWNDIDTSTEMRRSRTIGLPPKTSGRASSPAQSPGLVAADDGADGVLGRLRVQRRDRAVACRTTQTRDHRPIHTRLRGCAGLGDLPGQHPHPQAVLLQRANVGGHGTSCRGEWTGRLRRRCARGWRR
ncbi:hypothetical protein [Candidatus Poriferisodalis sp.]|uniref:hypothetical protein n=1 Tax=Candidatus Poriferisodalis sp. TaxID=3101277 RepID=UPI003B023F8A